MYNRLANYIQRTSVLCCSGIAYLALTMGFVLVMWHWNFQVIDEIFLKHKILEALAALNDTQKHIHILTTTTLDVAYPFAYGVFQAGMAYRFLGRWGTWIAPLSLICIPVDLTEGFAQIMILSDRLEFVDLKTFVTPLKLALYLPGLCGALVAIWIAWTTRAKTAHRQSE